MNTLIVTRRWLTATSTCGDLTVNDQYFSKTLEPRQDQSQGKPYCIPEGTYQFTLELSAHFETVTPHLQNVPGFTEVEIHWGNWPSDTEACLIVGYEHQEGVVDPKTGQLGGAVYESRAAFDALMTALKGEGGTITYITQQ
jgi:hypothetical protein